jgi:hypothetical protein
VNQGPPSTPPAPASLLTLRGEKWLPWACDGGIVVDVGVHIGLGARFSACGWANRRFAEREFPEAGFEVWTSTSIDEVIAQRR